MLYKHKDLRYHEESPWNNHFNIARSSTFAMTDHLSRALQLLASGQLDEARIYLEELLRQDPHNPDLLYNLGLCYVNLGQLDQGRELLHRCLLLAPGHSHACVALALDYQRATSCVPRSTPCRLLPPIPVIP
jgi:tetratricopeptide (TPR) repeat protein